ncbi:hypothetical protein [Acanthamoeba polyphaga mimivirus]|uniref:Uncharacterized protein n=4 Tax=Megamimivirinae TaxID=3044648 RepID=A0A2L2DKS4_MIMIV|nr:hypothetical protein MegaChil _gp1035 [Megavirus chiliensis]AEQ33126.1 hypothetical protein [Megavirus chiliensis]AGD93002.1 hypothetical protein LBA_01084 [Megavirus lba]AVG46750.1 hypothetical protein [Acanthamoeba polyphaga mimivirus]
MNNLNNELDDKKLGYTQCFKIIKGQMVPINLYAKMIIEPEQNPTYHIKFEPDNKFTDHIKFEPDNKFTDHIKFDDID